ncbi:hypothetical protein [Baaleninema sp.]|uniref:hypothetical protein n=1 Tax=Baaleninema sp. TaxID=3101197 RepID=UPI003D041179
MSDAVDVVCDAVRSIRRETSERPPAEAVVEALLALEKQSKRHRQPMGFDRLLGSWRLGFVTGTQKTRKRAGVVLGAGRYLPGWVEIRLSYARVEETSPETGATSEWERGRVENSVRLGMLTFTLTGPVKFLKRNRLLAFDFTRAKVQLFGRTLFDRYANKGQERESIISDKEIHDIRQSQRPGVPTCHGSGRGRHPG